MQRAAPYLIAASVTLVAIVWGLHFAFSPDPFAPSSAAVIVIGLVIGSLISTTGLLLSRGRWSRWLGVGVVSGTVALAAVGDPGPWYIAGLFVTAVALAGLSGPWLNGWVRRLPSAEGPGSKPVLVVLGSLALVPAVGIAAPAGLDVTHGILGGTGVLLAWAYAKAQPWALWSLRLVLPVLSIGSLIQSPPGGKAFLIALVGSIVVLAWSREARLAVQPLMDRLPGPRVATPPAPGEPRGGT